MTADDRDSDGGIRQIAWPVDVPAGYSERGRVTARTTNPIASPVPLRPAARRDRPTGDAIRRDTFPTDFPSPFPAHRRDFPVGRPARPGA
jgi:hypothetical protein